MKDCKSLTDELDSDYVAARTRSKLRLVTNEMIMSKANAAGGDLRSSENLATTFMMLGITDIPESALLAFEIGKGESTRIREPEEEYEPATYHAALKSPQAEKWKEAMAQEWQALIENRTFDIVTANQQGISPNRSTADKSKFMEEPIGCKWVYRRKINQEGTTR